MYFGHHNWDLVYQYIINETLYSYYRLSKIEELIPYSDASNNYSSSTLYKKCINAIQWFSDDERNKMSPVSVDGVASLVWTPNKNMIDNVFTATRNNNYNGRIVSYNGMPWQWWISSKFGTDGIQSYYINTDGTWWTSCISGPIGHQFGFVPHILIVT